MPQYLNKLLVAKIVRATMDAAFGEEEKALRKEEQTLFNLCYAKVMPTKELAAISILPPRWRGRAVRVRFDVCGKHITLTSEESVVVPPGYTSWDALGIIKDEALAKRIFAYFDKVQDKNKRMEDAVYHLRAQISGFRTVEKLAESWPEGAPYYGIVVNGKPQLPALADFATINALLPKKSAKVKAKAKVKS